MDADMIGRLAYLGLLLAAVAGWFFAQNRHSMGQNAQYAAIWGLIFLGVIAAVGMWNDLRRDVLGLPQITSAAIIIPRARDGHYHLEAQVNGRNLSFLIDTGASNIVLTQADAARVGFAPDDLRFVASARTANGTTHMAPIRIEEITLGEVQLTQLPGFVNAGELDVSLLGMDFLERFSEFTIRGDELILRP